MRKLVLLEKIGLSTDGIDCISFYITHNNE